MMLHQNSRYLLLIITLCIWGLAGAQPAAETSTPSGVLSVSALAVDMYPESNSWVIRPALSRNSRPQIRTTWLGIVERFKPLNQSLTAAQYFSTRAPTTSFPFNASDVTKSFQMSTSNLSPKNQDAPLATYSYTFPNGAKTSFPMWALKNADSLNFPKGENLSIPFPNDTIKFGFNLHDWAYSAFINNATEGDRWVGFQVMLESDVPIAVSLDQPFIIDHHVPFDACTNGSDPRFGSGPVVSAQLRFEGFEGTVLQLRFPDLSYVDNTTFGCGLAINSLSAFGQSIGQWLAGGRTQIMFDMVFRGTTHVEYDPDISMIFGANFLAMQPPEVPPAVEAESQVALIVGVSVAVVVVAVAVVFILIAMFVEPVRRRMSILNWRKTASLRLSSAQQQQQQQEAGGKTSTTGSFEPPKSGSPSDKRWTKTTVSKDARNSVMN